MTYERAPSRDFTSSRALQLAEVPRGRVRATRIEVSRAIAITTRAADPALSYRALAACLRAFELRGAISGRARQPIVSGSVAAVSNPEDLAVVARSLSYGRNLPLDLQRELAGVLVTKLAHPLQRGTARPEEAAESAAAALEQLLAGR